ncbi:MAG TPA: IS110 family transposase [Polyangiaceae bacterium]|nr:IS110 family transposase [Polyangiaceae bacterium]
MSDITIGIDWGSELHAVCVLDGSGAVLDQFEVAHDAAGLQRLLERLQRRGEPDALRIAVERPSGLLIDTLVDAGHAVVPIHPNVVKASRPRYAAVCGKSDRGDAYLLADLLRTDGHRFSELCPLSDEVKTLRALVRGRDDLVAERVALGNQLRSLLDSYWPGAVAIFARVDSSIGLAFVKRYPTPGSAARLGEKRLAAFVARHAYSGRRSAAELLRRLRAAPVGLASDMEADAKRHVALALVAALEVLVARIKTLTSEIEHAVAQLAVGQVMMSFPRAGRINAAQIIAELGDDPGRFPTEASLAAQAGVAPVTYASGKRRGVVFRWAANKRLRRAITTWADNSRHESEWAKDIYRRARARGCDHPHAVRILARAWVRVLWRCWRDVTPYKLAEHGAAARMAA